MSWLLLDAGNSALKWELVSPTLTGWPDGQDGGATLRWNGSVPIDAPHLASELARACAFSSALSGLATPVAVFGCAVTHDERVAAIDAAIRAAGAGPVQWLRANSTFEHDGIFLRNGYRDAQRLGPDRWLALIGARARYPRPPLAVINAGTATTVDGVHADGRFIGGVIAPGLELMRAALAQGTARLPLAAGSYQSHPDNTDDAIRTGILEAQLGLIERRVRRIREDMGGKLQVVLSGGNAAVLAERLHGHGGFERLGLEPDLVLRGMWHQARALAAAALAAAP